MEEKLAQMKEESERILDSQAKDLKEELTSKHR